MKTYRTVVIFMQAMPQNNKMFTGIIKHTGTISRVEQEGSNVHFTIQSPLYSELSIDQSVAHDGVCLTVVSIGDGDYKVTAIEETLQKTTLAQWTSGKSVNLELALQLGTRLDGHVVQGHVDGTGRCEQVEARDGSHLVTFSFMESFAPLMIEKGSVSINGVSLTAFNVSKTTFQVAIIPYTFEHTGFHHMQAGDAVNLEFDILGKYFLRREQLKEL